MKKIISIILLVAIVAIVFELGVSLGLFYQKQKPVIQTQSAQNLDRVSQGIIQDIISDVATSTVFYGKIDEINGQQIVLTNNIDRVALAVQKNTPVFAYNAKSKKQTKESFETIKAGDIVSISSKISKEKVIVVNSVLIIE